MANNTITVLQNGTETDITPKELQIIAKFKEDGMPGLSQLTDAKMTKALELYLSGKTYTDICRIVGLKKEIVLYLGQKFNWYNTKMEHLEIIDANIKERILHANLVNKDFVLQIQQFFLKKIGSKITRYLATGDDDIANQVDGKDLDRYQKYVELLDKLTTEKPSTLRQPTVGINLNESGVTFKKIGENEVLITPKQKTTAEMLKEFANLKRAEESKSINDIKEKDTQINTEKKEKD